MPGRLLTRSGAIDLGNPLTDHPLNRGRVMWLYGLPQWSGGGTWFDLCRRANGTLTNGPTWTPTGRGDSGLTLDGSDDSVALPGAMLPDARQDVTIAFWLRRVAQTGNYPALVMKDAGFSFGVIRYGVIVDGAGFSGSGNLINWNMGGGGTSDSLFSASSVSNGVWVRVVCTNSAAGGQSIYLDGRLDATRTARTAPPSDPSGAWRLGRWVTGSGGLSNAAMADVAIWARGFADADAWADFDQSRRGYPNLLRRVRPWVSVGGGGAAGNRRRRVLLTARGV